MLFFCNFHFVYCILFQNSFLKKMTLFVKLLNCSQICPIVFLCFLVAHSDPLFYLNFLKNILFIYSWETYRERQRHRQREKQAPCRESNAELDPRTPGSRPEPKACIQLPSHPGFPGNEIREFFILIFFFRERAYTWRGNGRRGRENLKQALHTGWSPTWGSISGLSDHDLGQNQESDTQLTELPRHPEIRPFLSSVSISVKWSLWSLPTPWATDRC